MYVCSHCDLRSADTRITHLLARAVGYGIIAVDIEFTSGDKLKSVRPCSCLNDCYCSLTACTATTHFYTTLALFATRTGDCSAAPAAHSIERQQQWRQVEQSDQESQAVHTSGDECAAAEHHWRAPSSAAAQAHYDQSRRHERRACDCTSPCNCSMAIFDSPVLTYVCVANRTRRQHSRRTTSSLRRPRVPKSSSSSASKRTSTSSRSTSRTACRSSSSGRGYVRLLSSIRICSVTHRTFCIRTDRRCDCTRRVL